MVVAVPEGLPLAVTLTYLLLFEQHLLGFFFLWLKTINK